MSDFARFAEMLRAGGIGAGSTTFFVDPERDMFFAFLSTGLLKESRSMERHQRLSDFVHGAITE